MASPTVDRRFGLVGNVAIKAPVAAIATGNVTLSGQQTIDGVALLAVNSIGIADRVLCVGQTDPTQNGIYDVGLNAWTRSADADGPYDLARGSMVLVNGGTTNATTVWILTTAGAITIGTTALTWQISIGASMLSAVLAARASAAAAAVSSSGAASSEAQAAAIVLGNFLQSGAGAVSRTFTAKARDFVSIFDFLPQTEIAAIQAGTSTYDCTAAINAALASQTFGSGTNIAGPTIYFPPGTYIVNSTIQLKRRVTLLGYDSGMSGGATSILKFPAGVTGFIVHRFNTINAGVEGVPTTAADGSVFQGLQIIGTQGVADAYGGHGIWMRARAVVRNCLVYNFKGNGFNVVATAGGGGALEGNANCFSIDSCLSYSNGGHGAYMSGADSNAGVITGLDASNNTGWGLYDSSFLGNTHIGCHTSGNVAGPYKTDNANATIVFLNCYSEGGQPASSLAFQAMAIGGQHGAGIAGGIYMRASTNSQLKLDVLWIVSSLVTPGIVYGSNPATASNPNVTTSGTSVFNFQSAGWDYKYSNQDSLTVWYTLSQTGGLLYSGSGRVGYATGAGGAVAQITNKSTGVTLNKATGQITMEATTAIGAGAVASFTLTSSAIGANDNVVVHRKSGGTANAYRVWVDSVAGGSCVICVENRTGGALSEALVLQFSVVAGAIA